MAHVTSAIEGEMKLTYLRTIDRKNVVVLVNVCLAARPPARQSR